uniref:SDR family NAD(P)-dependent oxidoreductase n=1 Tax=Pseudomonas aeruginosa TaxID=287 RepID=UPI0035C99580
MSFRKTLLITGASSGFGQALAREALDAGHRVVGTVRSEEARGALEAVAPGQAFGRLLDVTDLAAIEPTVAAIERDIGPLDVLVNSAGYGHAGIQIISATLMDEWREVANC